MADFIQLLFSGMVMGGIYAMIAIGFILIYNAVGVVNFAQGELLMIGAFIACTTIKNVTDNIFLAFIIVMVSMALVGFVFTKITYAPLKNKPMIAIIIGTVGVSTALQNLALVVFGSLPMTMPPFFGYETVEILGARILPHNIFVLAFTVLILLLQYFLFNRTSLGNKLRAVAQDKETSFLMGIKAETMIVITFMISAILAGFAGMLIAPTLFVTPTMGQSLLIKAFTAVVIGGFGSIPGAIVGGLLLGLLETFLAAYVSAAYAPALVFVLLILMLLFRPQGIFGEKISQKA